MFRHLAVLAAALACTGPALAADLQTKARPLDTPPVPVIGTSPFAIGLSLGIALSPTENFLTIPGVLEGDGPIKGYPIGPLAGVIASYRLIPIGPAFVDAIAEAHYDFSHGCVGSSCTAERKSGFLLQQGLEVGLTTAQVAGALPTSGQPANWPLPINVPSSLAANLKVAARGGIAERWAGLCAVIDMFGTYDCGNQLMWAPYGGLGVSFMASTNVEIKAVWDHVFWKQGNSFTPAGPIQPTFLNDIVTIKQEDDIKLQFLYHF